jgi:hypothetical protein
MADANPAVFRRLDWTLLAASRLAYPAWFSLRDPFFPSAGKITNSGTNSI